MCSGFAWGQWGLPHAGWSLWHQHTLHTQTLAGKCDSWSGMKHMVNLDGRDRTITPVRRARQCLTFSSYHPKELMHPHNRMNLSRTAKAGRCQLICTEPYCVESEIKPVYSQTAKLSLHVSREAEHCLGRCDEWCHFTRFGSNKQEEKCSEQIKRGLLQLAYPALTVITRGQTRRCVWGGLS